MSDADAGQSLDAGGDDLYAASPGERATGAASDAPV